MKLCIENPALPEIMDRSLFVASKDQRRQDAAPGSCSDYGTRKPTERSNIRLERHQRRPDSTISRKRPATSKGGTPPASTKHESGHSVMLMDLGAASPPTNAPGPCRGSGLAANTDVVVGNCASQWLLAERVGLPLHSQKMADFCDFQCCD